MAAACGTSRQNIEALEKKGNRTPHYIKELAAVMGVTVDDLMHGRYPDDLQPMQEATQQSPPTTIPASIMDSALRWDADRIGHFRVQGFAMLGLSLMCK